MRQFCIASLAQLVERLTSNEEVPGSNPCGGNNFDFFFLARHLKEVLGAETWFDSYGLVLQTSTTMNQHIVLEP